MMLISKAAYDIVCKEGNIFTYPQQVALLAGAKSSTVTAIFMGGIDTSFAYQAVKVCLPKTLRLNPLFPSVNIFNKDL